MPASQEDDWMPKAVGREWQAMVAAIRDGAPVPVSGAYGRHMIACIEAAMQADLLRREIPVA
jgi:predicted dehydrogenase